MPMKAVIFDFDGVLVNTEPLHFAAMRDALASDGVTITFEEYEREYLAYDDRSGLRVALEIHGKPSGPAEVDRLAAQKTHEFDRLIDDVPFFDGARELITDLSQRLPIAIASGALRGEIERILRGGGLLEHFTAIIGADDVRQGKPHPEPYLMALGRLQSRARDLRAADCLVIEDSMAGIASGLAAGMRVLAVSHSYPPAKLSAAHTVVPALRDVSIASLAALFTA
jgi:beta-phosphoglucomutase